MYLDVAGVPNGGAVEVLAALAEDERFLSPQLLPGGDAGLFTVVPGAPPSQGGYEQAEVVVQTIGSDDRTVVWRGGSAARYVPTDHLVYAQGSALFAIAFDVSARAVSGGPVPLMDGMRRSSNGFSDTANYPVGPGRSPVFSRDGTQLFFQDGPGISVVPIEYEPTLRVGAPSPVLESTNYMWQLFGRTWDPDPSGERFIVPRSPSMPVDDAGEDNDLSRIDVVVNWTEELKARVPTQ